MDPCLFNFGRQAFCCATQEIRQFVFRREQERRSLAVLLANNRIYQTHQSETGAEETTPVIFGVICRPIVDDTVGWRTGS